MIPVATAAQIRECDRATIDDLGLPGLVLMENASRSVAFRAFEMFDDAMAGKRIAVYCGKGNNGGDGFATARHLHNAEAIVKVFLIGSAEKLTGDAAFNCQLFKKIGGMVKEIHESDDFPLPPYDFDLAVDALLGTGFKGEAHGLFAEAIDQINTMSCPVIAVDMPSGVEADTGKATGSVVEADVTVTFGLVKRGLLVTPGREMAVEVAIADISIPRSVVLQQEIKLAIPEDEDVQATIPQRLATAHKGMVGHVLIIAGSPGFTGAAALAGEAALRTGCGLVMVGVPASLNAILEAKLTEVMTVPLPESKAGTLTKEAYPVLAEKIEWAHVVVIGPGLGRDPLTAELLALLLENVEKPLVIDADGLNLIAEHPELLEKLPEGTVLTPHPGEFNRLKKAAGREWSDDPFEASLEFAQAYKVNLVLKGAPTIVTAFDGRQYLNPTGNAGMATGGSGDVLTGMIASLAAQGANMVDAAWLGVYLHGQAGDRAADALGQHGMLAGDIVKLIPEAIKMQVFPD